MNFDELSVKRFSVRKFKTLKVEDEKIEKIINAGLVAPTAKNNQPIRIKVIKSESALEKFKKCTVCHYDAPLAFIISANLKECYVRSVDEKSSHDIDASIVTTHMMMQAADIGIGSTWLMNFIPNTVKKEFNLDKDLEPVSLLVMGYAADDCVPSVNHTAKKNKNEIVSFE